METYRCSTRVAGDLSGCPLPWQLFLAFEQELYHLRRHVTGALIEFLFRKIGNRMRHTQEFVMRHTPGLRHGASSFFKHIGDD
jgi:hypothetical protein